MLIVADENIARVREAFAGFGEVRTLPGRSLSAAEVRDADVLLVRSVTPVGRELLAGSRVRFVGSATIGTDHLDIDYLDANGIAWSAAPGCNATAVAEYVLSALAALDGVLERLLSGGVVGVIGLGNVGSRLAGRLRRLGIRCIGYDPLLDGDTVHLPLCDLDPVLAADVVCCHVPLTRGGEFPTLHMLDAPHLARLRPGAVLLNAGRGGAVDGIALAELLRRRTDLRAVLDVWEGEPAIDRSLLGLVELGTPHIAGYSVDGKLAGTLQILEACARHCRWQLAAEPLVAEAAPSIAIDDELSGAALLRHAIHAVYDVRADDRALRDRLGAATAAAVGVEFDQLRKSYPPRREFAAVRIDNWGALSEGNRNLLRALGFGVAQAKRAALLNR
jgi:erythronate-4-phosphate dehydrogenase